MNLCLLFLEAIDIYYIYINSYIEAHSDSIKYNMTMVNNELFLFCVPRSTKTHS